MIAAVLALSTGIAGVLFFFALGTLVHRVILEGQNADPNGAVIYIGTLTLVAGTANENLGTGKWSTNTVTWVNRITSGGTAGHLSCDFNNSTGVVTVTSSSATETSTIAYFVLVPG